MNLSDDDKRFLLEVARSAMAAAVNNRPLPRFEPVSDLTARNGGAFVTIRKGGSLRGCIGMIESVRPLAETVSEMAVAAALRDPRFEAVRPEELETLEIEISVMSPVTVVEDTERIVVGRDGLIVRSGAMQGLLLPQVATEYGWDRETFLEHTCRKAGLPPDAWKMEGTEIRSFSAVVFGESSLD